MKTAQTSGTLKHKDLGKSRDGYRIIATCCAEDDSGAVVELEAGKLYEVRLNYRTPDCPECGCTEVPDIVSANTDVMAKCSECGHEITRDKYYPRYTTREEAIKALRQDTGFERWDKGDWGPHLMGEDK